MFYLCYSQLRHPPSTSTTQHHIRRHQEDGGSWWSHNDDEYQQQWHQWLGNDTGTGNTLTIWSRVCMGMGTGLSLPNPHNTVPVSTVSWVFRLPTFRSGEWSYDLVDSLTLTTQHFETTPTTHHHHSTPNHCREKLLTGWKQGARMASKQPQWPQDGPNDMNYCLG